MNNNRINGPAISDHRQAVHLMLLANIKKEKSSHQKYDNYYTLVGKVNLGHQRGVMLMC